MKSKKTIRCLLLLTMMAAGSSAQAQTLKVVLTKGTAYTIRSTSAATSEGGAPPRYQWYRNNVAIPFATGVNYTVPVANAEGANVEFKRKAYMEGCGEESAMYSNTVTITWCSSNLLLDGVCWADANVDNVNTFAAKPDMYTKFYLWNMLIAYSTTDPITPAWGAPPNYAATWTVNPCPEGWRLPTQNEYLSLIASGSSWVASNERGNSIPGRFFGANHATCVLPNSMAGCIFIPASGHRDSNGALGDQGGLGRYWTAEANLTEGLGYYLNLVSGTPAVYMLGKSRAFTIRCVQ